MVWSRVAANDFQLDSNDVGPRGITSFTGAVSRLYVINSNRNMSIYRLTGSYAAQPIAAASANTDPTGIVLSNLIFYIADSAGHKVYVYNSGFSTTGNFPLDAANTDPVGIAAYGGRLFIPDATALKVFAYELDGTRVPDRDFPLSAINPSPTGMAHTGTRFLVLDNVNGIIAYHNDGTRAAADDFSDSQTAGVGITAIGPDVYVLSTTHVRAYMFTTTTHRVSNRLTSQYKILGRVTRAIPSRYSIVGRIARTIQSRYDIREFPKRIIFNDIASDRILSFNHDLTGLSPDHAADIYGVDIGRNLAGTGKDVWVMERNTNNAIRYDRWGAEIERFDLDPTDTNSQGACIYRGRLYTAQAGSNRRVFIYDMITRLLVTSFSVDVGNPRALVVFNDTIYVAVKSSNVLYAYDLDGARRSAGDLTLEDAPGIVSATYHAGALIVTEPSPFSAISPTYTQTIYVYDIADTTTAIQTLDVVGVSLHGASTVDYYPVRRLTSRYGIHGRVSRTITSRYGILGRITRTITSRYGIIGRVSRTITSRYDILSLVMVVRTFASRFSIRVQVSNTLTSRYGIRRRVSRTITSRYDILNRIRRTITSRYGIIGRVTRIIRSSYNIHGIRRYHAVYEAPPINTFIVREAVIDR